MDDGLEGVVRTGAGARVMDGVVSVWCLAAMFVIDGLGSDPVPCVGGAIPNRGLLIAGCVARR